MNQYFNLNKSNNNSTSWKPYPVTFAYLISASKGDIGRLKRLLYALYHPGNYYLVHMDYGAPEREHRQLAEFVRGDPVFSQVGNVWIVGKSNLVTYRGPTMLSTTLHAMAILLRVSRWDWFINLSASDYPLVSQDGMVSAPCFCSIICANETNFFFFFEKKRKIKMGLLFFILFSFFQIWFMRFRSCLVESWISYNTQADWVGNCKKKLFLLSMATFFF